MARLSERIIFVRADDAEHATGLVRVLDNAGADTVVVANAYEGLQRLDQFKFDGAVIDCATGADKVAAQLKALGVPFCVCGGLPPESLKGSLVAGIDDVVEMLERLVTPS
jgi:CheY-like chemotaxis protein